MPSSKVTFAPKASIANVLSRVEFEGSANSISKSKRQDIIANAMPVLPLVASINLVPGLISPRSSALRIILSDARSFTLPPGLLPSSLAYMVTLGLGLSFFSSTIGVLPMRSIIPDICLLVVEVAEVVVVEKVNQQPLQLL